MDEVAKVGKWTNKDWSPRYLKHDWGHEPMSSSAGLARVIELFTELPLYKQLKNCLPDRISNSSYHPLHFALVILSGFWLGYDCLDDHEKMKNDPVILAMFGEVPSARAIGDFLRDFEGPHLKDLRSLLARFALDVRRAIGRSERIEFSVDSTDHLHHGDLIEGLQINYKGHWCLDSLEVFDELGFCYDFELRPGATFSSVGAVAMMNGIMDRRPLLPTSKSDLEHADSAFCNEEFITMCLLRRLKGTITAHGNIGWMEGVANITNWQPWVYSEQEVKKALLTGIELPKIEVGYYMYFPDWAKGKISFPVVIKRTFKPCERISRKKRAEMIEAGKDPKLGLWEHYAVLSLMGLHPKTPQNIIESHNTRSNMENMIKEGKIAFDLRHFPCRKFNANHAYALLGMLAHNFFRLMAIIDEPQHPKFAKALRAKFVHFPGRIIKGAGKLYLRVPKPNYEEVTAFVTRWMETLKPSREFSSA